MRPSSDSAPTESVARYEDRFESMYAEAEASGDRTLIPWDHDRPNPLLVQWLDHDAAGVVRCGARVAVVGCGLGHDARELIRRGFEVTAFDISPTAIQWAKRIDPEAAESFFRADLFAPPPRWVHRFDLVVEVHTLQALPPETRSTTMSALARITAMNAALLVICRATDVPARHEEGPPWPLTPDELLGLASGAGLRAATFDVVDRAEGSAHSRIRALLTRA
ncbi:MAG TPA: methyltransferase domain-containing protein [Phycisphaerales bacterium]|nr:methyltransferase domain-containing protein [Phycisphaerales bacterium]HMP38717.1 methyltransferase domain-containing protein [Phycisphaerales bacterium]